MTLVVCLYFACAAYGEQTKKHTTSTDDFVTVEAKAVTDRKKFFVQVSALLKDSKYDDLEALADNLRKTKAMYPAGRWHLDYFYEFLSLSGKAADQEWEKAHCCFGEMGPNSSKFDYGSTCIGKYDVWLCLERTF